jgi:hypothetical protein
MMEKLEFQNLKMKPIFEKESFVNVETDPRLQCTILSSKIHPLKPSPKNKKGVSI